VLRRLGAAATQLHNIAAAAQCCPISALYECLEPLRLAVATAHLPRVDCERQVTPLADGCTEVSNFLPATGPCGSRSPCDGRCYRATSGGLGGDGSETAKPLGVALTDQLAWSRRVDLALRRSHFADRQRATRDLLSNRGKLLLPQCGVSIGSGRHKSRLAARLTVMRTCVRMTVKDQLTGASAARSRPAISSLSELPPLSCPRSGWTTLDASALLIREHEPEHYEKAALRWVGRFALEAREATLADVRAAADALAKLPTAAADAMAELERLCLTHRLA
jgi:hypothetical protein